MATVALLLRVRQVAMATGQTHHQSLGVVEGGGLVVQAVRADGGLNHVELLQLGITSERETSHLLQLCWAGAGGELNYRSTFEARVWPVVRECWPEWTGAAGHRSLRTRCPGWSYAETESPDVFKRLQVGSFFIQAAEIHELENVESDKDTATRLKDKVLNLAASGNRPLLRGVC